MAAAQPVGRAPAIDVVVNRPEHLTLEAKQQHSRASDNSARHGALGGSAPNGDTTTGHRATTTTRHCAEHGEHRLTVLQGQDLNAHGYMGEGERGERRHLERLLTVAAATVEHRGTRAYPEPCAYRSAEPSAATAAYCRRMRAARSRGWSPKEARSGRWHRALRCDHTHSLGRGTGD